MPHWLRWSTVTLTQVHTLMSRSHDTFKGQEYTCTCPRYYLLINWSFGVDIAILWTSLFDISKFTIFNTENITESWQLCHHKDLWFEKKRCLYKCTIHLIWVILSKSFCISCFLHELILNIESKVVQCSFFVLFSINNMYTFLHKKKINLYIFDQYFWLEITNTWTTKQSIIFFHQLV